MIATVSLCASSIRQQQSYKYRSLSMPHIYNGLTFGDRKCPWRSIRNTLSIKRIAMNSLTHAVLSHT